MATRQAATRRVLRSAAKDSHAPDASSEQSAQEDNARQTSTIGRRGRGGARRGGARRGGAVRRPPVKRPREEPAGDVLPAAKRLRGGLSHRPHEDAEAEVPPLPEQKEDLRVDIVDLPRSSDHEQIRMLEERCNSLLKSADDAAKARSDMAQLLFGRDEALKAEKQRIKELKLQLEERMCEMQGLRDYITQLESKVRNPEPELDRESDSNDAKAKIIKRMQKLGGTHLHRSLHRSYAYSYFSLVMLHINSYLPRMFTLLAYNLAAPPSKK